MRTYRGKSRTTVIFGDSLAAGVGMTTSLGGLVQEIQGELASSEAIGGQNWQQILARFGTYPVQISVSGNAFSNAAAVSVTGISTLLLSTGADNTSRTVSGAVNGIACFLKRDATGGPPSTAETYTLTPFTSSTAAIPAGSLFIPDAAKNYQQDIVGFWPGRNNTPNFSGMNAEIVRAVDNLLDPQRYFVIGVLPALNEIVGTTNYIAIAAQNAAALSLFPGNFIPSTPPTDEECAWIGYTLTAQDLIDRANGVFPTGMHATSTPSEVHLNRYGYQIFALRIDRFETTQGW